MIEFTDPARLTAAPDSDAAAGTPPRYIDLQVNGYAGVDFNNDHVTEEDLHKAAALMQAHGVARFLPTIITEQIEVMVRRIAKLARWAQSDPLGKQMVAGLHVEGPFVSEVKGYVGAHPPDAAGKADAGKLDAILEAGQGLVRIFTLAPEQDQACAVIRRASDAGVVVSAGHTNASLEQLDRAIDAGLAMFTHLGNGCANQIIRHDNIIERALSRSDHLWIGFIADGVHVPKYALRNYLRAAGLDRCFVVSDAMSAAGLGPGKYKLGRREVLVGEDRAVRSEDGSHLVGSAVTMRDSAANLIDMGLNQKQVDQLTVDQPALAARLDA